MKKYQLYLLLFCVIIIFLMPLVIFEGKVFAATVESIASLSSNSEEIMKGKGRALSMKSLQKKVKDTMTKGPSSEDTLKLYGINKVLGYVIDEKYGDIIQIANQIIGSSSPERVQQNLPQWHGACAEPQQVRVLGIPFDSRFAKVMVDADYYMKKLVDGSTTLEINGFSSLTDMTMDIIREDINKNRQITIPLMALNRFWFYPGKNDYLSDEGIVYIKKSDVKLLTEEKFLTRSGDVAGTGRSNILAQQFADKFTDKYKELAEKKPIYKELDGLFRFVALARLMKYNNALSGTGDNLYYLMNQYALKPIPKITTK